MLTQGSGAQTGVTTAPAGRFALVAFAPESIVEDLRKVRAWCPRSGVPTIDCHVPLSPRLQALPDPAAALGALARAVHGFPAFTVRTTETEVVPRGEGVDVVLALEESAQLELLRERVVAALGPLTAAEREQRRPDVPVVEAISRGALEATLAIIAGWRLNYAWVVRDLDLVALQRGRLWRSPGRLDFGRP